jgi:hypothetical protein
MKEKIKKEIGWYKESIDHFLCGDCFLKMGGLSKEDYKSINEDDLKKDIYTCDGCRKEMRIEEKNNGGEPGKQIEGLSSRAINKSMKEKNNVEVDNQNKKDEEAKKIVEEIIDLAFIIPAFLVILSFIINFYLGLSILSVVAIIFAVKGGLKKDAKKKREEREKLITEANQYVEEIKSKKAIPIIKSSIFLKEGESAFLEENTDLQETRAVRTFRGGSRGVGFRVAKGISVRAGGFSGTSESNQEWTALDTGNLIITNQRLIFNGSKENRSFPIEKILSVETFIESIRISINGRAKSLSFPVQNPYIWSTVINIVCSTKNPLKLDNVKLDIVLK